MQAPEPEGDEIPLYEQGGTMLFRPEDQTQKGNTGRQPSAGSVKEMKVAEEEPDFMKYIKGVNLKANDQAYLQQHF